METFKPEKPKPKIYLPEVRKILEDDVYLKWGLRQLDEINDEGDTKRHTQRVTNLSYLLAKHLKYSEEDTELAVQAGVLHDIGKMQVDSSVLTRPSEIFSDEDMEKVSKHALNGYGIVESREPRVATIILLHHMFQKKYYPKEINLDELNVPPRDLELSRRLAMVDVFDTVVFGRQNIKPAPAEKHRSILLEQFNKVGDEEIIEYLFSQYETIKGLGQT